jgi:hypothetical protein
MATLIYSTRMHSKQNILTYTAESIDQAVNTFIDKIFIKAKEHTVSKRLEIKNGRYLYTPSEDYTTAKQKLIRVR